MFDASLPQPDPRLTERIPAYATRLPSMGIWEDYITRWLAALGAAGRPKTTLELRRGQLNRLRRHMTTAGILDPADVTVDDLADWLDNPSWSVEYRRSNRAGLRSFFGWAVKSGRLTSSPAHALLPVRAPDPAPRPAPLMVYTHALSSSDERLRLMLRLACDCGLRRAEVASVTAESVEDDLHGYTLRVIGKGRRVRRVPLPDDLARDILRAAPQGGHVFPGADQGHLSPRWVGKLVGRALPGGWTMHTLRHRFATDAYAIDRDTFSVQRLLGHASSATTERYVQVPEDSLRYTVNAVAAARRARRVAA